MSYIKSGTNVPTPSDTVTEVQDLYRVGMIFAEELTDDDLERRQIARDYVFALVEGSEFMPCMAPGGGCSPSPYCVYTGLMKLLEEKEMTLRDALERLGFTRREAERPLREAYAARHWAGRKGILD